MELTLEIIKELAQLLDLHKLDKIKLGDLELVKTKHESLKTSNSNSVIGINRELDDEELLFYSSSAPPKSNFEAFPELNPKKRPVK